MFLLACSSDSPSETNNADQPITPSNLTFDINIFGQSNSNPNGDGSGLITCVATATDAVSYEFRLGDGVAINSTDGQIDYTFTSQGTNSYTVYVYAYSSTGHYISSFLSFDLFVEFEANQATWSEEFNNDGAINADIWTHEIGNGDGGWGNGESQYYTNSLTNSFVEDGVLKITAKRENIAGYDYTSARIISRDKFEFQYGRVDIRAKLPTGMGTWPALWLLGANFNEVGWPACGEIDIMEHWGHDPTVIAGSIHTPMSHGDTWTHGYTTVNDYHEEFHIYSIDWNENRVQFFVDDVLYYTYSPSPQNSESWPFDQEMFFILNVAMGGHWFDIDPEFSESTMEVDYIRIYQ
tara:strand:- start:2881 stop:3933 length:1053 start_codon:yes stop_codon:yes gene_type:complete